MKITHTKKKGKAWTITLKSNEEATKLKHVFGCYMNLEHCNKPTVKHGQYQKKVFKLLSDAGIQA